MKIKVNISNFFKENILAKSISLAIAIILWIYVNYENLPEKYLNVSLNVINIPKQLTIANNIPKIVSIKIKGKYDIIQTIHPRTIFAYIDLKNTIEGKNIVYVRTKLKKKKNIKIINVVPYSVKVYMEKIYRKEVPVAPTIINSPAEGYIKAGESFYPTSVIVEGPKSIVEKMEVIRTKPIDIGGVTGSIYKDVEFDIHDVFVRTVNYNTIKIKINIKENFKTIIYNKFRVVVKNLQEKFIIANKDILFVKVKLKGPEERLKHIRKLQDVFFIDLRGIIKAGKYEKKVRYKLPWNCSLIYFKPKVIKLNIIKKE